MTKEYNSSQASSCLSCFYTSVLCQKGCKQHLFSLKPISPSNSKRTPVEMTFCPFLDKSKSIVQNTWPVINFDGKPHLPSFMLEIDKIPISLSESQYLESFNKRHSQSLNPDPFQPYPGFEKNRCHVCKCPIKNYKTHIRSKVHRQNIRKNKCEDYIKQIQILYLQTIQNVKNQFQVKRLKKLQKSMKMKSTKGFSNKFQNQISIVQKERNKNQVIEIEADKQQIIDHQQQTLTIRKSQDKTGLSPNSMC